jgi:16S rRNA (cytosine1402-N4)-methyltransferase
MIGRDHIPVLLEDVLNLLDAGRPGLYLDGTLGLAGHSQEILKRNPNARLVGFDRDADALAEAQIRLRTSIKPISAGFWKWTSTGPR